MRDRLHGAPLLAAAFLIACGTGAGDPAGAVATKRAPTLIGYGVANHWPGVDPTAFATELARNGLTATLIEYVPWFDQTACGCKHGGGCSSRTYPAEASRLVRAMRRHAITTHVNVVNWNGCGQRAQDDHWFQGVLDEVLALGPDLVQVNAVSEPWVADSPKPWRWTTMAQGQWPGIFVQPDAGRNHPTGKPYFSGRYDLLDIHYCVDDQLTDGVRRYPQGLHNTDCSGIVNPGQQRAARMTRAALDAGANLIIYGFVDREPDLEVIRAMGAEVQR